MTWMKDDTGKRRDFAEHLVDAKLKAGWQLLDPPVETKKPSKSKKKIITVDEQVVLHMVDTVKAEPKEE